MRKYVKTRSGQNFYYHCYWSSLYVTLVKHNTFTPTSELALFTKISNLVFCYTLSIICIKLDVHGTKSVKNDIFSKQFYTRWLLSITYLNYTIISSFFWGITQTKSTWFAGIQWFSDRSTFKESFVERLSLLDFGLWINWRIYHHRLVHYVVLIVGLS